MSDLFSSFRPAPAMEDLSIRTPDGHVFRGDAALIEITPPVPKGPAANASITLSVADRAGVGLSVAFDVTPEQVLLRDLSAAFHDGPGGGTLAYLSRDGAKIIGPGKIMLNLLHGRVRGKLETKDPSLAEAAIDGRYEVVCMATPEMLGAPSNGETSEGTWILVEDEAKTSAFCSPFADF